MSCLDIKVLEEAVHGEEKEDKGLSPRYLIDTPFGMNSIYPSRRFNRGEGLLRSRLGLDPL